MTENDEMIERNKKMYQTIAITENSPSIKLYDLCRIKLKKNTFEKMKPSYSNEIYIIDEIKNNRVKLIDENDKPLHRWFKISDIQIIKRSEKSNNNNNITKAEKEHKINIKLNKLNINENNVVKNKRNKITTQQQDYVY